MRGDYSGIENIIPACFAETILMQTLGYSCGKNHQRGDGKVLNNLKKIGKTMAIAVMDRPVGTAPNHIKTEFVTIETGSHNLFLKKHKNKNHYIIYIDKVLEEWIFEIGKSSKVSSPYKNVESLRKDIKLSSSLSNKRLLKYFESIHTKNPTAFKTIDNWIKELNK